MKIKLLIIVNALFAIFLGANAIGNDMEHLWIYTIMIGYCAWFPALYWFDNETSKHEH